MDQLVFEELVRERFPKLGLYHFRNVIFLLFSLFYYNLNLHHAFLAVNHLDYLGVQVAWVIGPWFLSIFVNMLPWESG